MQESFAAQLIVLSGYLERSETGFGGGFVTLFWHILCLFGWIFFKFIVPLINTARLNLRST